MTEQEKPKRCRHLNGELLEIWDGYHYRNVWNGVLDSEGINEQGLPISYRYICASCKRTWRAKTISSFKPKWLKKIGEQL